MKISIIKFLLVSIGRCGSTLLSAILDRSGANFGLETKDDWDRTSGDYEHPLLDSAYKSHRASETTHQEIWPCNKISNWFERRRDTVLKKAIDQVNFAKLTQLIQLVHPIFELDFNIRIIIIFRSFSGYATSGYRRFGWNLPKITEHYCTVNRMALLQLHLFGGCAVSFEELTYADERKWAQPLSVLTDTSKDRLLEGRQNLLREPFTTKPRTVLTRRHRTSLTNFKNAMGKFSLRRPKKSKPLRMSY